jgi:hypothetical protein
MLWINGNIVLHAIINRWKKQNAITAMSMPNILNQDKKQARSLMSAKSILLLSIGDNNGN